MLQHTRKQVTGECENCEKVAVLTSQFNGRMMLCDECIARENAVVTATKVIEQSHQNDSKITTREDVMTATTTSFIELHGAILNNPDIPADQKKYVLAQEVTERIKNRDAAIFTAKAELAQMENERFAWLKNLQPLVATLRTEEQAKFKQFNVNYKPVDVTVTKIRKVSKSPSPRASSSTRRYTPNQIKEACEKHGADRSIISSMLLSPVNRDLTIEQVIQKYLARL